MRTAVLIVLVALVAAAQATKVCHNITGTCLKHGFVCANEEVVKHSQRCDGIEDCSDGTDEFMCEHPDHRPLFERTEEERREFEQAGCVNCNCAVNALLITSSSGWWPYAKVSPTDTALMTGGAPYGGMPCNANCADQITIGFYKKNRICRGWLCCARQRTCNNCNTGLANCGSATPLANRCYG